MSNITTQLLNPTTGEIMDGNLVYLPNKHRIYRKGYVAISQEALIELFANEELPNASCRLLVWLLQFIDHNNKIPLIASELIKQYPHSAASFYKALKPLLSARIFVIDKKQGSNVYYALNSKYGWKGKVKNWHINDPEDPLFDLDKTHNAC